MTIEEIIRYLEENNPYPSDVFTEPSLEDWKKAWKLISDNGIVPDKIAGKWGRMVWNNCIAAIKNLIE
jgi:hypothetical protein